MKHPFTPEDRAQQQQLAKFNEREIAMRDATYVRDHPRVGKAGLQRIYRFPNNYGAQVDWLYSEGSGWHVTPIEFFDMEITSYMAVGPEQRSMSEKQAEQFLSQIEEREFVPLVSRQPFMYNSGDVRIEVPTALMQSSTDGITPTQVTTDAEQTRMSEATLDDTLKYSGDTTTPAQAPDSVTKEAETSEGGKPTAQNDVDQQEQ